jgi:hypothetical protein
MLASSTVYTITDNSYSSETSVLARAYIGLHIELSRTGAHHGHGLIGKRVKSLDNRRA